MKLHGEFPSAATRMSMRTHARFILLRALYCLLACFTIVMLFICWRSSALWSAIDRLIPDTQRSAVDEPPPSAIPKKLWYKLGPKGLNEKTRAWTDSCISNNTDYEVEFMTDDSADAYVQDTFGSSHPDLVAIYLGLTVPILKADILRYLLLFIEGGVYNDLDVSCERPISEWIPPQYQDDAAVVIGWEFDVGWGDNFIREFATWSILSRPGSPHMWMVVQDIQQSLQDLMRDKGVSIEQVTLDMVGDVVDATGPRRFTRSILKSIEGAFNTTLHDIQELLEPILVGDVLVLPGYAFAASANTYDEGMEVPPPLVLHHYAGSWKNEKGGETA